MSTQGKGAPPDSADSFFTETGEKKRNLRRIASEVGNMAAGLQSVRSRAAAQEAAIQQEADRRQVAEANVRDLGEQLEKMRRSLQQSRSEAQSSATIAEQSLEELMEVTERLAGAEELAEFTAAAATSFRRKCESLLRELEQKNSDLVQHRSFTEILEQQVAELEDDAQRKETSERQLRHEVEDLEAQVEMTVGRAYRGKEHEFQRLLNEVSARNIEHLEQQMLAKDDEIAKLRKELGKQQSSDQESQEKIDRREFCLGEAQRQIRKLRKTLQKEQGERNLAAQIWLGEGNPSAVSKAGFWSNLKLPGLLSLSAVALVCIIRR